MYQGELKEKGADYQAGYFKGMSNLKEATEKAFEGMQNKVIPKWAVEKIIRSVYENEIDFAETYGMEE